MCTKNKKTKERTKLYFGMKTLWLNETFDKMVPITLNTGSSIVLKGNSQNRNVTYNSNNIT